MREPLAQCYLDLGITHKDFEIFPEDLSDILPGEVFVLSLGNSRRYSAEEYKALQEGED